MAYTDFINEIQTKDLKLNIRKQNQNNPLIFKKYHILFSLAY